MILKEEMNPMKKLYAASSHNYNLKSVFNPQPFNIDFELNIAVKNAEDGGAYTRANFTILYT